MTVTYLGSLTVAGGIPGLSAALGTVGNALASLKVTCEAQFAALLSAAASINAQASAVLTAQASIRIPATVDIQAQLDASLAIGAALTLDVGDPSLYLAGLLEGLVEVEANISALIPSVALSAQIDASVSVSASMELKLAAIDLQLSLLASISLAISVAANALVAIQGALSVAISAVVGALALYARFFAVLGAAGVNAFLYVGALSGFGAAIDAVASVDTGFSGSLVVRAPVFIYDTANAGAVQGMQLCLSAQGA